MSFAQDTGYIPATIQQLMILVRDGWNAQQGTSYDEETFLGTNAYKFYYALIQRLQENEVRTAEIVLKLQQYFSVTNEAIVRPNTTHPGIRDYFTAAGYLISTKAPLEADAGKLYVCVQVDDADPDYDDQKLEICQILARCVVAGVVTMGTEVEAITLSNDQSFDFKFYLPTEIPIKLRLTLTTSQNNQFAILSTAETTQKLFDNINARYRLGLNFEPQRYFSVLDAPWTSQVLLEWSDNDGADWSSDVEELEFDDLFTFELADISVVEA